VRDGERFIGAAIESVLAQDWPVEILVVDDGSRDGSAAVAARHDGVLVLRQEAIGVAQARNAGVARATGEHVALLDADDLWLPGKLVAQIGMLEARPELGYVLARYPGAPGQERLDPRFGFMQAIAAQPDDGKYHTERSDIDTPVSPSTAVTHWWRPQT